MDKIYRQRYTVIHNVKDFGMCSKRIKYIRGEAADYAGRIVSNILCRLKMQELYIYIYMWVILY